MEPNKPPTPTPASDSHPSIPVSHPRSSPRSPASSSSSQPPISPPRPSIVTPTATQTTSSCSLVAGVPEAAAPPMSRATLSNSAPMVQPDPEAPGVPTVTKADSSEPRIVPNVYINGLPPNFPEEQLYALTKDFGGVVSVRTFTRHVSDRPSYVLFNPYRSHPLTSSLFQWLRLCPVRVAHRTLLSTITSYSFIRFDTIESAEKCIEALRRYRNLHPSFCKAGSISLCCISVTLNYTAL